jgi:hypothetical protein
MNQVGPLGAGKAFTGVVFLIDAQKNPVRRFFTCYPSSKTAT